MSVLKLERSSKRMDGVSWSTSRPQESFSRSTTADTLSRLASFIARSNTRPHAQSQQQLPRLPLYVCPECGKGFPYAADLLQHQELKHTLPKPHRCPSCGQEFSLRSSLQLHRCSQDPARCERCHAPSQLGPPCPACATRVPPHHPSHLFYRSPYACAPCGRSFSLKQALLQHQQAGCSEPPYASNAAGSPPDVSPQVSEGGLARSDLSDASVCQVCSRTFRTEAALQRHKHNDHLEKLKPRGDSNDEEREEGTIEAPQRPKSKLLRCRSCDMVFRSTSKLYVHRKEKHSREKSTRREARPAVKKHRKVGVYPCQICCRVFFHHLSLRAHLRRHALSQAIKNKKTPQGRPPKDSKPSENTQNKTVNKRKPGPGRPRKVKVPERAEEEEKEFPCPSCPEVFALQQQLKEHTELHRASEQKRQCSVCACAMESCKGPGSRRHRLYHCVPCGLGFSALDSFLQHCQEHLRLRVEEDRLSEGFTQQARKA